jgi:hypothetical protein
MQAELESAKAELARAKAESAAAQQAAERSEANLKKSRRDNKVRLRLVAVVMLTAALVKIAWQSMQAPVAPVVTAAPLPATPAAVSAPNTIQSAGASDTVQNRQFVRSLNRLRDAFHAFPEKDQMDLVREINQKQAGGPMACPLAWNAAGIPSLSVGDNKGQAPPSMIVALDQCASAVEKLRAEKEPAQ